MASRNVHRLLRLSSARLSLASSINNPRPSSSYVPYVLAGATAAATFTTSLVLCDASPLPSFLDVPSSNLSVLSSPETATGVPFPLSANGLRLQGKGVRYMGGVVKVYALGFYADPTYLRTKLKDWIGFSKKELLSAPAVWDRLCEGETNQRRMFRFVVVREVNGKHMQKGFDRGLMPRAKERSKRGRCKPKDVRTAVKLFAGMFVRVGTMKVGSEIRIELDGDKVMVWIDDRWMGEVRDAVLAWALNDMYLGVGSVTQTLREEVAGQLEQVLTE